MPRGKEKRRQRGSYTQISSPLGSMARWSSELIMRGLLLCKTVKTIWCITSWMLWRALGTEEEETKSESWVSIWSWTVCLWWMRLFAILVGVHRQRHWEIRTPNTIIFSVIVRESNEFEADDRKSNKSVNDKSELYSGISRCWWFGGWWSVGEKGWSVWVLIWEVCF